MQFSKLIVAAAAFAVAQAVQFDNTVYNNVTAGMPYTLTWSGAQGPVTLTLKDGPATNLQTVSTIASGLTGTSYTWDVPSTQASDTYAFEIMDGTGMNYSPLFQLIDGVAATSSASSASTSGSSSASSTGSSTSGSTSTATSTSASTTATTSGSTSTGSRTTSTGSSTSSRTTTSAAASTTTSAPGSAAGLESPLAFVFLALAAFFTLN